MFVTKNNNINEHVDNSFKEGLLLFCQYYKTNDQLLKFLLKFKQYVHHNDDLNIFNQYVDILNNESFDIHRVTEILNWISLILPDNVSDKIKKVLLSIDSHVGGLRGSDDEIVFKYLNLKTLRIDFQKYFIYKYQQKVVINKMIFKRDSIYAIHGYVLKYIGNGIEKAV